MQAMTFGSETSPSARVEIDCETLLRLLSRRQMQLCELRCLDAASKELLRRLALANCAQCLQRC